MTIRQLRERVHKGEKIVVRFKDQIERWETCIDPGMIAEIVNIEAPDSESCSKVLFDLSRFDKHNDRFACRNYYDKNGSPVLTAKEAGYYPKNGIESIWFDVDFKIEEFEEIDEDSETGDTD